MGHLKFEKKHHWFLKNVDLKSNILFFHFQEVLYNKRHNLHNIRLQNLHGYQFVLDTFLLILKLNEGNLLTMYNHREHEEKVHFEN